MCFCLVSSLQCFPQKAHSLSLSGVLPLKTTVKITSWVSSVNESHRYCFSAQQKAPVITPGATKYLKLDPSPLPSSQTSLLLLADITFFCLQVPKAESLFVSLTLPFLWYPLRQRLLWLLPSSSTSVCLSSTVTISLGSTLYCYDSKSLRISLFQMRSFLFLIYF